MSRGQRRSERASRIERSAGERPGNHDAQDNAKADGEAGNGTERGTFIDSGGEDSEYEKESGDAFEKHAVQAREVVGEHGCTESNGMPGVLRNNRLEQKRRGSGSGELGGPIGNGVERVQAFGNPEADGDGGV